MIPRPIQDLLISGRRTVSIKAIVLHADISGFTSMTENLMKHGKTGAGVLSGILGIVFSRAIHEIYKNGGVTAEFEGDAFIAVFPENRPENAFRAADTLRQYFKRNPIRRTELGEWPVSVRLTLSHGTVEWGIIGDEKLIHYIRGSALTKAISLSYQCKAGEMQIDQSFNALSDSIYNNPAISLLKTEADHGKPHLKRIRKDIASRFVSDLILSSKLTGEFREVTHVFISLRNDGNCEMESQVKEILDAASVYGGDVNGFYFPSDKDTSLLVLFGAPVSWENNTSRAFDFSIHLHDKLGDCIRMGIAKGTVYAGMIGSSKRCTYTVYGDTVNIAARLVSKAEYDEILVTEEAVSGTEKEYSWSDSEEWRPRGKAEEIVIRKLYNQQNPVQNMSFEGELVGRSSELKYLIERTAPLKHGAFAGITTIYGEAGIGKSRLLFEVNNQLVPYYQTFILKCDDILQKSLNPIVYFLKNLFHQDRSRNSDVNRMLFEKRLLVLLDNLRMTELPEGTESLISEFERSGSIIGSLLGHFWEGSVYEKLTPESKFENISLAFRTLIKALSTIKPVILFFEDIHRMDDDTRRLIRMLTRNIESFPFTILASSRYRDDGSRPDIGVEETVNSTSIDLSGVRSEFSRLIISKRLDGEPGEKLVEFILQHSSGNPFYIEQFCLYLKELGLISLQDGYYEIASEMIEVPSGIRSILVARMDRLSPDLRIFIQTASIFGQEFDINILSRINGSSRIHSLLKEGQLARFWSPLSRTIFSFNHSLYRDTAYGMLLGKRLRMLHAKAARVIMDLNMNDPKPYAGEIAFHLENSGQRSKAIEWGWKALCFAMDNYKNHEVLDWANRLQGWLMSQAESGYREELLLDVMLRKDSILYSLGEKRQQKDNIDLLAQLCQEEDWMHRKAEVLKTQGSFCLNNADITAAFRLFKEGLAASNNSDNIEIKGKLFGNIANLHAMQGHNTEARKYYDKALEIHRTSGNRRQEGVTLGNLAILLRRYGELDKAEKCYKDALQIHREVGNRSGEGTVLCGLGHLTKNPESALAYYRHALRIDREIGDRRNEAIILSNLGRIETLQKKYGKASVYLDQALQIHRQIGNPIGEADTHCLHGENYYYMKNLNKAREHLQKAVDISKQTENSRSECIYQGILGLVNFEDGRIEDSVINYKNTHKLIMEYRFPDSIDESIIMLRDQLLEAGVKESELPYPEHWKKSTSE